MMIRSIAIGLALFLCGCLGDMLGGGEASLSEGMEPDPSYHPKEHDRAQLYGVRDGAPMERLPILKDITAFDTYQNLGRVGDSSGIADLEAHGDLSWAVSGSRIVIVAIRERPGHSGLAAEVRLLEEAQKGREGFTPHAYLARLRAAKPQ